MSSADSAPSLRVIVARVTAIGLAVAAIAALAGRGLERSRLGPTDADALARVQAELTGRVDESANTLTALARRIGDHTALIRAAGTDAASARGLFDAIDAALPDALATTIGVTVYGMEPKAPLAWSGRVSDLPSARVTGPAALFIAPGALGPRLVRIEPVMATGVAAANDRGAPQRVGAIVVEQLLAFSVATSIVPVTLRTRLSGTPDATPFSFSIASSSGQVLVDASVSPEDLAGARRRWRDGTRALTFAILAATLLLCTGPFFDRRRPQHPRRVLAAALLAGLVGLTAWRVLVRLLPSFDLPLTAISTFAAVWLGLEIVERWRRTRPRLIDLARLATLPSLVFVLVPQAIAGLASVWVLVRYELFLRRFIAGSAFDALPFSLYPFDADTVVTTFALLVLHASVVWGLVALKAVASTLARTPREWRATALEGGAWILGAGAGLWLARRGTDAPVSPWLGVALAAVVGCWWLLTRGRPRLRHASQAARLMAFFLALLVPALAMYPTLSALSTSAKETLMATEYGPRAINLRDDLQQRLQSALLTIDRLPSLETFVTGIPAGALPTTDRAFELWSQTDLARFRVTSAVELYATGNALVSRFALSLPDSGGGGFSEASCTAWDALEEVSPFGSTERHVLRASRSICAEGRRVGSIVVRAMLDYRTLPFIASRSPYLQSLAPADRRMPDDLRARDVEFAVYGWSRAPLYASGTAVWPLPEPIFEQMAAARSPVWSTVTRGTERFRVHFSNDRGGIYALGYPVVTVFGHLVNLAEIATLCGVLYLLLLAGATLLHAVTFRPASGRALLREVRSSFYRKLFLAFVAAAVVPVVILALATRAYFASQFRAEVEDAAVETATVAQRLVEDYATLQDRDASGVATLDDAIMVLVSRAIDESVNLFDRDSLRATSERDLFASGRLPARTPGDVYRSIVLDRLPTFVGEEEIGGIRYLLAAAPVRAAGRAGIVTVPQTLRQPEIERRIDELDRRILFAAVLFVLLGAALGYWMAERIADPVNRLTRATRRIARGDLDARIATTSSDELRRLVEDFNHMAADLKRQRQELERTQRLEAWAEMARQVAHDIKNPLTPIQLSAEHARRVNLDKGSPLSPVLDECVNAILNQVRLLRQISSEFSSFASSPVARPEPVDLPGLVESVVQPYRAGLAGRVQINAQSTGVVPAVFIDRTLFARALTNIIENALHAMPGGGAITIAMEPTGEGGKRSVRVAVADTGVGMDQEALARLFEPYFSTKATGTGLGLTIAKRNVELNGGTISVASERGTGTTVTMSLPCPPLDMLGAPEARSPAPSGISPPPP